MSDPAQDGLIAAIQSADRAWAVRILEGVAARSSYETAIHEVLAPAMETFGERWGRLGQDACLAEAYVASKIAEDALALALAERWGGPSGGPAGRGPVVVGNILDDFHPLGRKMVSAFLRLAGWQVYDLGVDVPPGDFLDKAEEVGARVIGVSAMMSSTARNIPALREEIRRRGLTGRVQLAVGGAVFNAKPSLVAECGGDGTASSALQVPVLFETLWQRSLLHEGSLP